MKRSAAKGKKWDDHYSRRAIKERYPARSVYKLQEMQQRHKLIRKGNKVLDLGCSPGSWLLYAAELTEKKGQVVGIDLKPVSIQVPSHVKIVNGDILSLDDRLLEEIGKDFDVVLSDLAPDTTGNRTVDAARSFHLCQAALSIAKNLLKPGGAFVCKIFQGEDFKTFSDSVRASFNKQKIFKPKSSRKASREIFIIGLEKIRR